MHDGGQVIYTGPERDGLLPGVRGRVLSCTALYGHVQWEEGPRAGTVELLSVEDLATPGIRSGAAYQGSVGASLNDSLEVGSLVSLASAEEAYDAMGSEGLISHLTAGGHLAAYSSMAEEVMQTLIAGLQQDPVLHQLTALMDPEEAEEIFRRTATLLLIDNSGDS